MSISKPESNHYDILFIGLGVSSIIHFLKNKEKYKEKSICFIEKEGEFQGNKVIAGFSKTIDLPIRKSFYEFDSYFWNEKKIFKSHIPYHVLDLELLHRNFLEEAKNCSFYYETKVENIEIKDQISVFTNRSLFYGEQIFDSRPPQFKDNNYLKQHFLGYIVLFKENHNIERPILMDINPIAHNFQFFYLIPFTSKEILIENTYYGLNTWEKERYEIELEKYIKKTFPSNSYTILKKEQGVLPLINVLDHSSIKNYHCLGVRKGHMRASTGYSVFSASKDKTPRPLLRLMDTFLLKILYQSPSLGSKIFSHFMKHIDGNSLAEFMGPSPKVGCILKAIFSMPLFLFLKHLFKISKGPNTTHIIQGPHD